MQRAKDVMVEKAIMAVAAVIVKKASMAGSENAARLLRHQVPL